MSKVETLTNASCKKIMEATLEALVQVEQEFGISFTFRGGTIEHDYEAVLKLKINVNSKAGSKAKETIVNDYARTYGLPPMFEFEFVHSGKWLRIVDINPRARKYPFLAECMDGSKRKVSVEILRLYA